MFWVTSINSHENPRKQFCHQVTQASHCQGLAEKLSQEVWDDWEKNARVKAIQFFCPYAPWFYNIPIYIYNCAFLIKAKHSIYIYVEFQCFIIYTHLKFSRHLPCRLYLPLLLWPIYLHVASLFCKMEIQPLFHKVKHNMGKTKKVEQLQYANYL